MPIFALHLFLVASLALRGLAAEPASPQVMSVKSIKELSPAELERKPSFRIEGVVTYYDADGYLFFVQDSTAGVYVRAGAEDFGLRAGDLVRVEGIAAKGRMGNVIDEPVCTVLGRAPLPAAKRIDSDEVWQIGTDCHRVEVTGILRSVTEERGRLIYYVGIGNDRLKVTINTLSRGAWSENLGKTVSIRGVHAALYDDRKQRTSMTLYCVSLSDVRVVSESASSNQQETEVVAVSALAERERGTLARVQILADRFEPGQFLVGHDSSGELLVRSSQMSSVSKMTVLDVTGYVGQTNGAVLLEDAYFRRIGYENKRTFSGGESPDPGASLIESAAAIRRLTPEQADRRYPVRLRGVITYYEPDWCMCFVQGASEGIYVNLHGQALDISPGDLVVVSGYSSAGDFAPVVATPKFDVLGRAPMPATRSVPFSELLTGAEDSQWLKIDCVVRAVRDDSHRYFLEIAPADRPEHVTEVVIPISGGRPPPNLKGARVEIDAVCATRFDSARRILGVTFYCPDFRNVVVVSPASVDPFAIAVAPIASAFKFTPQNASEPRIHVTGTVTWTDGAGSLYLQDESGGIRVFTEAIGAAVGQQLDVVGHRRAGGAEPALEHAWIRRAGPELPFAPLPVGPRETFADSARMEGRLLRMSGHVIESRRTAEGVDLLLQGDGIVFSASLAGSAVGRTIEPAAVIEVTGVAVFTKNGNLEPQSMRLLARTPSDIVVQEDAPVWNSKRLAAAVALLLLLGALAGAWILMLRREIGRHKRRLERNLEEQRALETRVVQSQKMESIGVLAGGVAHDFNNLLSVIMGYMGLLDSASLSADDRESLKEAMSASERAAELTKQLLLFSRKRAPEKKIIDLNELVSGVSRMLKRVLGEDISLETISVPEMLPVHADRGMLEQVLLNLAVNARDAMPDGGSLKITVEKRLLDQVPNEPDIDCASGCFACLIVSDSGEGISRENLPKIFEPFFTTKEVGKGTGLGLATVYGIVKQHRGWVHVESEVGRGTTFTVFLPVSEEAKNGSEASRASAGSARRNGTILLVEDDECLRRSTRIALQRAGYSVIEAESGRSALEQLPTYGKIDLLLSDVVMPGGVNGADLSRDIRVTHPNLPIILMSGYPELRGRAMEIPPGAVFIQKPFSPQALLDRVAGAFSQSAARQESAPTITSP